jgi:hypothetical protein
METLLYNHPLQLIHENVPGSRVTENQGAINFFNLCMSQNQNGPIVFDSILKFFMNKQIKIGKIIELGTARGGLSVLLGMFSLTYGCKYVTYDIYDSSLYNDLFKRLDIDFRKKDIFECESEISKEIQSEGITILFCDGGDKAKEFNMFSKYLKPGDLILAHDYAKDHETFEKSIKNNIWCSHEIELASIEESIQKYNLIPFLEDLTSKAAICCFQKQ